MRVREAPRRVLKKTTRAKIRVVALGFKRKEHGHHPKQLPWDGVKGGGVKGKQPCLPAHQQKPRLDLSASHTSAPTAVMAQPHSPHRGHPWSALL